MSLTKIIRGAFVSRQKEIERYDKEAEALQMEVLHYLMSNAKHTEYGRKYSFGAVGSYSDYASHVPVNTYEELKGYIDRMRHGECDLLWKGSVKWYAKSSGTTNDKQVHTR